jgi:3,4-dihydroxy 2-butanone 4-phosphate synthase/GTP cyclohydrolase II
MSVASAVSELAQGGIVVVVDDEDRENEGDLIMAADAATEEKVAFILRHGSGLICAALTGERCDALGLPQMVPDNQESQGTAFTLTVDAARGITTGISAADRARTIATLADRRRGPDDLVRPGHVLGLRSRDCGVLERRGHTEAAVDLARLAGGHPSGVLCEVMDREKQTMAQPPELRRLASRHRLPLLTIAELAGHRMRNDELVEHVAEARLPTRQGDFVCHAWRSRIDGAEHLALVHGAVDGAEPVLVRVHSECLTGDVLRSRRCDCGAQLDAAMREIVAEGAGVIVYLRGHEGRGIGLGDKVAAYNLQDGGCDTVEANLLLGHPPDDREYGMAAQILRGLGVTRLRLMTNNPAKRTDLEAHGIEVVERVPMVSEVTRENSAYLDAKRRRLGHLLPGAGDRSGLSTHRKPVLDCGRFTV